MSELTRRGFLGMLGATAAAVIILPSAKLWVPEESQLILPQATEAAKLGNVICGWVFSDGFDPSAGWLSADAFEYFPSGAPLMILDHIPYEVMPRFSRRHFRRFMYRGSGDPMENGKRIPVLSSWANASSIIGV